MACAATCWWAHVVCFLQPNVPIAKPTCAVSGETYVQGKTTKPTTELKKPCFQAAELALLDVLVYCLDQFLVRMEGWKLCSAFVQGHLGGPPETGRWPNCMMLQLWCACIYLLNSYRYKYTYTCMCSVCLHTDVCIHVFIICTCVLTCLCVYVYI